MYLGEIDIIQHVQFSKLKTKKKDGDDGKEILIFTYQPFCVRVRLLHLIVMGEMFASAWVL